MSSLLVRERAIIPLTPTADQSAARGVFVENSSGNAAICNAATDIPLGVILEGATTSGKSSIGLCGALDAIVKVKCHSTAGTITVGTFLCLHTNGTVLADAGSGARVQVARAMEAGANSALIDAILINPVSFAT